MSENSKKTVVMKRYLLFTGSTYYASGGWKDFAAASDNLEALSKSGGSYGQDIFSWWHIVDLTTGQIVAGSGDSHSGLMGKVAHEKGDSREET